MAEVMLKQMNAHVLTQILTENSWFMQTAKKLGTFLTYKDRRCMKIRKLGLVMIVVIDYLEATENKENAATGGNVQLCPFWENATFHHTWNFLFPPDGLRMSSRSSHELRLDSHQCNQLTKEKFLLLSDGVLLMLKTIDELREVTKEPQCGPRAKRIKLLS